MDNLIDNCLRHALGGSTMEIRATVTASELRLRVSDDGPGLPPVMLAGITGDPMIQSGLGLTSYVS